MSYNRRNFVVGWSMISFSVFSFGLKLSQQNKLFTSFRQVSFNRNTALDAAKTMFDKIWESHLVDDSDGNNLLYIDRHLVHEVTSPQAFEGLRVNNRKVRRPDCTLVTVDHNIPTTDRSKYENSATFIQESASRLQVLTLEENVQEFGLTYFGMNDPRQGIVHIIGPEQGFTLPGSTIVCGDSHTATHGAFGALAFGIGTSEVEHVLATQTLVQSSKPKNMRITVQGELSPSVTSKDIILHIIGVIGTAGGTGYVIEFAGEAIRKLSIEGRMSICNMAIEAGARAGMIAPDEITFNYIRNKPMAPQGKLFDDAVKYWQTLPTEEGAHFDKDITIYAKDIAPTVTWGTSPQDVAPITGIVPNPAEIPDPERALSVQRSLDYMGLQPGTKLEGLSVDKVFIGSCTNARIEDIRAAAEIARGRKVAPHVYAMVVPGSGLVKAQAELEGLDVVLKAAGFDWREPGCSMCLAMNPDKLEPGERCASTSNRNFEGRQGTGGRTHLVSPAMAAAAAVFGKLTDIRNVEIMPSSSSTSEGEHWRERFDTATLLERSKAYQPGQASIQPAPATAAAIAEATATAVQASTSTNHDEPVNAFKRVEGIAAKLDIQNIDTDMIIPKQFLKTIKRSGLGKHAFHNMRYNDADEERADFILNQGIYRQSSILIVGDNFGCGSSREHAPWALRDLGIRCIISTSFADIFYNNCFKNGILPIKIEKTIVRRLMDEADAGGKVTVDLSSQTISIRSGEVSFPFDIDSFRKHCLFNGLDDIGLTMQKLPQIARFEEKRSQTAPWLDNAACLLVGN